MRWTHSQVRYLLVVGAALLAAAAAAASAEAQVASTRSAERMLFLIPDPGAETDAAFVVALAEEVRKGMRIRLRNRVAAVESQQICEVLEQSAYPCDAILSPADAARLAQALQVDAYIIGTVWHENSIPQAHMRLIDLRRSGYSGFVHIVGTAGDPPKVFATIFIDTLENQVRAAEFARECSERSGQGDFKGAMDRAQRAFRIYPNHPASALCAEVVAEALKYPADSQIAYLERAVRGDSLITRAWERLGRLYQAKGDTASALEAFVRQSDLDRNNRDLRQGVIAGAISVGQFDRARQLADDWLAANPSDLGILQLKARACVEGALWQCALQALSAEYERDTSLVGDTVFYQQIIGAAQALSDTAAQLRWTGEAVQRLPNSLPLLRAHASALATAGMRDSVLTMYERMLALEPSDYRSALAGARLVLEDLVIDTLTTLDTAGLRKAGEFLDRATTASSDTSVLMNAALLYYQKGSALVRTGQAIPVAVDWLQKAVQFDLQRRLSQQANFFLGWAIMLSIYEFDTRVTTSKSCELVAQEADMIARGKRALELGRVTAPSAADSFLQRYAALEGRIPQLRKAYSCP